MDRGHSAQQTTDGGYIVTGFTTSYGGSDSDLWLIKTDSLGDTLWTRTYGGSSCDEGFSVQQTADGGYIVTGFTTSYGGSDSDLWLIKTDSLGDTLWTMVYNSGGSYEKGKCVRQTADGGYVITGAFGAGAGCTDVWLVKTDSSGNVLWTNNWGTIYYESGSSVEQTADGGYIITGTKGITAGQNDVWLIKTDSLGNTLWTQTYGGSGNDSGNSVQQTPDGGYIINGIFSGCDVYLIRTDASGDTLWTRTYGGTDTDYGWSVDQTADNGYVMAGYTWSFAGYPQIYVIRTDSSGDTLWTMVHDDVGSYGWFIEQTADSGYIVAGYTGGYQTDVLLMKLTDDGVGIQDPSGNQPQVANYELCRIYPNPFNDMTDIRFSTTGQSTENIELEIYDVSGRVIKEFSLQSEICGWQSVNWNGTDQLDRPVPPGIYYVRLTTPDECFTRQMTLLR
jgi:hypothetical protein